MATLKEQLQAFNQGQFLSSDGNLDTRCFVFYDWFCKDSSLERKANKLFKKVKTFIKHFDIDLDNTYVFFKNNCPLGGSLYDDFRIVDIKADRVLYTVTPKCGHNGQAEIWSSLNDFDGPLYQGQNLSEIYRSL